MNDYLLHSSKGTSWRKKQAEYDKKINKRYYYSYEAMLKKLWKLKQRADKSAEYQKLKAEYEANKKSRANAHVAKIYGEVADKTGSSKTRKSAEEYQRRANDAKLKKTRDIKLVDITSDMINKGKLLFKNLLKKRNK